MISSEISEAIVSYVDFEYAEDLNNRSLIRYVFTLYGSVTSWKATLQFTIALSTTKVEYMATTKELKEVILLRGLVSDLGLQQELTIVYCDSQSVIHLMKNQIFHDRTNVLMSKCILSTMWLHRMLFQWKRSL